MLELDHAPGRALHWEGQEWLFFSGTAYLGIPHDPVFRTYLEQGFARYGTHYGSSRLSNLRLAVYQQGEAFLSAYTGAEAALTLSSGSLAGQLLVHLLAETGELFFAPGVHPALWRGYPQPPARWESWQEQVLAASRMQGPPLILLSNSIDPLYAQTLDFSWLDGLGHEREIILVLDDSHGFGITGEQGAGIFTRVTPPSHVQLLVISSLSKAFGLPGGVILGAQAWIDRLWRSPYFGGASPMSPAYLAAFLQGQEHYALCREKLAANIDLFHKQLVTSQYPFQFIPGYPVFYTPQDQLADALEAHNIIISSFPYPTAQDPRLTRIVLSAAHTPEDILRLANVLKEVF